MTSYAPGTVAMVHLRFVDSDAVVLAQLDDSHIWRSVRGHQVHRASSSVLSVTPLQLVDPSKLVVIEATRAAAIEFAQKMGDYDGTTPGTDISRKIDAVEKVLRSLLTSPKPAIPECPEGCVMVVDATELVWSVRDGGYWETANSIKALTWAELMAARGPLRPVGPVLSAGIGEAE